MKLQTLLIIVVCAVATGLLPVRLTADEPSPDPRLEKILADWQKRRDRIKTIRYRVSGEVTLPKGTFRDPNTGQALGPETPPHDISWPKNITLLLDFTTNRHRLEENEQPYSQSQKKSVPPRVTTTVFDSKELWSLSLRPTDVPPNPNNPDVSIVSGNMRGLAFSSEYWPFFLGHGVVGLITQQHILPGRMSFTPKTDVYHVQGDGNYANRACVVLRTQTQEYGSAVWDELWVDLGRESAILRQVAYANGKIVTDIQIDYQETRGGWLPQSWTISHARNNGQVFSFRRMRVDELEVDPAVSDADFRVDVKKGMIVQRMSYPGSPDDITSPNPDPISPVFRAGQDGTLDPMNGPKPRSLRRFYLGGVGTILVLAAGIAAAFWWRRRNRQLLA